MTLGRFDASSRLLYWINHSQMIKFTMYGYARNFPGEWPSALWLR